jgi:hypothetical protein
MVSYSVAGNAEQTRTRGRSTGQDTATRRTNARAVSSKRKFLRYYPGGFQDGDYFDLERGYKWKAHIRWREVLGEAEFRKLLRRNAFSEIAARAVAIESRTNLLFSF